VPKRTRSSNPKKGIPATAPAVSRNLKSRLIRALKNEFGNGPVSVPQLVTKFPRQTGPRDIFVVTVAFKNTAAKPKSYK
jgi:hypothetical protein